MTSKRITWRCHDCGVDEGRIHKIGCDMERCPICGQQLISCGHVISKADYNRLPYRIPYILIPNLCALCGEQWPELFKVSDAEWKKYVIPPLQKEVLCRECYEEMKRIFPKGWKIDRGENNDYESS